jgi:hypothetical protein
MKATLLMPEDLTHQEKVSLWDQNVILDDWDFMVLTDPSSLQEITFKDDWDNSERKGFCQNEETLDRLLKIGGYEGVWYKATFQGVEYAIGIRYHS